MFYLNCLFFYLCFLIEKLFTWGSTVTWLAVYCMEGLDLIWTNTQGLSIIEKVLHLLLLMSSMFRHFLNVFGGLKKKHKSIANIFCARSVCSTTSIDFLIISKCIGEKCAAKANRDNFCTGAYLLMHAILSRILL